MARILIATTPALPLARRLVERGHEVRWYTSAHFRASVEASGASLVPLVAAAVHDLADPAVDRHLKARLAAGPAGGPGHVNAAMRAVFVDPAPAQLADCEHLLREEPADLLLTDSLFVAGPLLQERAGIVRAQYGESPLGLLSPDTAPYGMGLAPGRGPLARARNRLLNTLTTGVMFRDLNRHYDAIRARVGLPPVGGFFFANLLSPYLFMPSTVAAFEYPRRVLHPQVHFVGPLLPPPLADAPLPPWWAEVEAATCPVVVVTQGTVATDPAQLLAPALTALAGEDALVVATTGGAVGGGLTPDQVPANARLAPFVPFDRLLPRAAALVTNGGYGGVQMALAHGVPLVVGGPARTSRRWRRASPGPARGSTCGPARPPPSRCGRRCAGSWASRASGRGRVTSRGRSRATTPPARPPP